MSGECDDCGESPFECECERPSDEYSIENLIDTFKEHHIKFRKNEQKLLKQFKEDYPEEPIPEEYMCDFSVALALFSICKSIKALHEDIQTLWKSD